MGYKTLSTTKEFLHLFFLQLVPDLSSLQQGLGFVLKGRTLFPIFLREFSSNISLCRFDRDKFRRIFLSEYSFDGF